MKCDGVHEGLVVKPLTDWLVSFAFLNRLQSLESPNESREGFSTKRQVYSSRLALPGRPSYVASICCASHPTPCRAIRNRHNAICPYTKDILLFVIHAPIKVTCKKRL
jgi:hypothetical protein